MKGISVRQKEILQFVEQYIEKNRHSPSYREIGTHFGLSSVASVYKHIQTLKKKGMVLAHRSSRSLALTQPTTLAPFSNPADLSQVEIPFIGTVAAGAPIQLYSHTQHVKIMRSLVRFPEKTYALRAVGNSLNEEMILEGDLLLVEAAHAADSGHTILALINGQDTLIKKYYHEGEYVQLVSLNARHDPIVLHEEDLQVQGILVGLIRSYSY